jgi:tRNA nucleotidyltransferase (CCA-adding enzyme)
VKNTAANPQAFLRENAPWLLAPELGVCVVGSAALAEACRRAGVAGPCVADLDLAWALDIGAGEALLRENDVWRATTPASRARGTLALGVGDRRIEITGFRGDAAGALPHRIVDDLGARDMTVGALAWWLERDQLLDPLGGLDHWRSGMVVPCGDVRQRIREHPVRWIRYYRRAHEWGFSLDRSVRKLPPDPALLHTIPTEATAAEFRAALLDCASPGRLFLELYDVGLLATLAPELAPQFDGRPAGPVRHHPEVSQAQHVILSLEWLGARTARLPPQDRLTVAIAVLCHDLGKGLTPPEKFPAHTGHESSGGQMIATLLDRLPGLADASMRRMAKAVGRLHLEVRRFNELRPGTLVDLYERYFRQRDFRVDLFALAVGADSGGRLGRDAEGDRLAHQVEADLTWLRERCEAVDAAHLREQFGANTDAFKAALHERRAAALRTR